MTQIGFETSKVSATNVAITAGVTLLCFVTHNRRQENDCQNKASSTGASLNVEVAVCICLRFVPQHIHPRVQVYA